MTHPGVLVAAFVAVGAVGWCAYEPIDGGGELDPLVVSLMRVEDLRPATDELAPLIGALTHEDPRVVRVAVRGLGRLERVSLLEVLAPLTGHLAPEVRSEAVNAVAQAVSSAASEPARGILLRRATLERDGDVRAALARSLGRLQPTEGEDLQERIDVILALGSEAGPDAALGAVLRLYHLARHSGSALAANGEARAWLADVLTREAGFPEEHSSAARIRRVAALGLASAGGTPASAVAEGLSDVDGEVRRLSLAMVGADEGSSRIEQAMTDPYSGIRVQALRMARRLGGPAFACDLAAEALDDPIPQVRLAALDALAQPCPPGSAAMGALTGIAGELPEVGEWHEPARALAALARVASGRAAPLVAAFAEHADPFVRVYAARAAGLTQQPAVLEQLARDPVANVRTAAITGLADLRGHASDDVLLAQLDLDDPQLLLTAAARLEGSPDGDRVLEATLAAFERTSALERETDYDARIALLERVAEFGGPGTVERLRPFLEDYDRRIATRVAELMSDWGDRVFTAPPRGLPPRNFPTVEELRRMRELSVVLTMTAGEVEILLLPDLAPANSHRFASLVASGYFDGLTFHRVVPNFVVQGGSPGANEYFGDGPYTRDELGLEGHWRGAVGVSTRGRDTGDGQVFINLVDNVRLDHSYTIFGVVVRGMDVVDRLLEGDPIHRATVVNRQVAQQG